MKKKIIYYQNELEDEFSSAQIKARAIDENYDYDGGLGRRIARLFVYVIFAKPVAFIYLKLLLCLYLNLFGYITRSQMQRVSHLRKAC